MDIDTLRNLLRKEQETQTKQWLDAGIPLKELRKKGSVIHPIRVEKTMYGYGDYPILKFSCSYEVSGSLFKNGTPVALFDSADKEHSCNGNLLYFNNGKGEIMLFSDDFPSWSNHTTVGIKVVPDTKSFDLMHGVLKKIASNEDKHLSYLYQLCVGIKKAPAIQTAEQLTYFNTQLNVSQQSAVQTLVADNPISILHGPPGTGKTTTLIEVTQQFIKKGKKVAICAPSNTAIDHFAQGLLNASVTIFRVGNTARVDEAIWNHTIDGILAKEEIAKPLKKLKIQANEYRKLSGQYKRNFGREEQQQRKLLYQEWKALKKEIKDTSDYHLQKKIAEAQVILGTPVGLNDFLLKNTSFDVAILDEAGQCLFPLAWVGLQLAPQLILGGDPFQLPPTVIDHEAGKEGLSFSLLETAFNKDLPTSFLDTQYRMYPEIAAFSSAYFYNDKLFSAKTTPPNAEPLLFIDTAGADYTEQSDEETSSLHNEKELSFIEKICAEWELNLEDCVLISPYAAQVQEAKKRLTTLKKISTIDAFQGQEATTVILSLVRSNSSNTIGFLADYRRMNVALTRAKEKLIIIGDSATIGGDPFYNQLITHIENQGGYHSIFEYIY